MMEDVYSTILPLPVSISQYLKAVGACIGLNEASLVRQAVSQREHPFAG